MYHHNLAYETIFLTPSLIGSINDKILVSTNRDVFLIELNLIQFTLLVSVCYTPSFQPCSANPNKLPPHYYLVGPA